MKTYFWDNRALAGVVLAAAILAGVFGIGGAKLKSAAAAPVAYYEENMAADFAARESAAQTILGIASNSDVDIKAATQALTASLTAKTPGEKYRAGIDLATQVGIVYNSLPADERDQKGAPAQMAWSEFTSRTSILGHAIPAYNELAAQAEKRSKGFPAALVAKVNNVYTEAMV